MFYHHVAKMYIKNEEQQFWFQKYVFEHPFNDFNSFFNDVDRFCYANNIVIGMNQHTQDRSATRKLTAKIFQYVLFDFAKKSRFNKRIKLSDGIQHDLIFGDIKIDAKLKNGQSKFFNKDYQLTIAYNSQNNNNNADLYCFGNCASWYWSNRNVLNYVIAGVIDKETFYTNARVRKEGQVLCDRQGVPTPDRNGNQMIAKKPDYVIYAEMLRPIETILR